MATAARPAASPQIDFTVDNGRGRVEVTIVNRTGRVICAERNNGATTTLALRQNGKVIASRGFEGRPPPGCVAMAPGARLTNSFELAQVYPRLPSGPAQVCYTFEWAEKEPFGGGQSHSLTRCAAINF